jgi:hypothetical protein
LPKFCNSRLSLTFLHPGIPLKCVDGLPAVKENLIGGGNLLSLAILGTTRKFPSVFIDIVKASFAVDLATVNLHTRRADKHNPVFFGIEAQRISP